jgi:hypothetical protein
MGSFDKLRMTKRGVRDDKGVVRGVSFASTDIITTK